MSKWRNNEIDEGTPNRIRANHSLKAATDFLARRVNCLKPFLLFFLTAEFDHIKILHVGTYLLVENSQTVKQTKRMHTFLTIIRATVF